MANRTPSPSTRRAPATADDLQVVAPSRSTLTHLRLVWRYRELLAGLVRKDLKVRYKNSALGFAWSLMNPALYLVVYWFVFDVLLEAGIPAFPIWLLSGLLVWNLFTGSLIPATQSITGGGSLVRKVYFPREILPLASVGASFINFLLQFTVLLGALLVFTWNVDWAYIWLVPIALVVVLVLSAALGILFAAVNVYARDTQHLLEVALTAWFWLTPIVYAYDLLADRLAPHGLTWLLLLNPMTSVVTTFQRAIYGHVYGATNADGSQVGLLPPDATQWWYLRNLLIVGFFSSVLLVVAIRLFDRLEGNFAEEI